MEKTRNNKKPTKELRGPDKNQTAGKAGYSRAEQDAQKNYEKSNLILTAILIGYFRQTMKIMLVCSQNL